MRLDKSLEVNAILLPWLVGACSKLFCVALLMPYFHSQQGPSCYRTQQRDKMPHGEHPRSLRQPTERDARRSLLWEPHIAPLSKLAVELRSRLPGSVPDFDPMDGGINAKFLFLFEKPGPMTDDARGGRAGSGFISRDNDDATAEATFHFMRAAVLDRRETVIWNVIPWWDGHVRFTGADRQMALRELDVLLALLPQLQTVVLVGNTAARAEKYVSNLRVVRSAHPSPRVRATNRALWESIPIQWKKASLGIASG